MTAQLVRGRQLGAGQQLAADSRGERCQGHQPLVRHAVGPTTTSSCTMGLGLGTEGTSLLQVRVTRVTRLLSGTYKKRQRNMCPLTCILLLIQVHTKRDNATCALHKETPNPQNQVLMTRS